MFIDESIIKQQKELKISIVFPNQLFDLLPFESKSVVLIEEHLFFTQYKFHKTKIVFHRASMKRYEQFLKEKGFQITYIEAADYRHDIRECIRALANEGVRSIEIIDPCDNWLEKRIHQSAKEHGITVKIYPNPSFLNSKEELETYFKGRVRLHQTDFYVHERKKRNILLESNGMPKGGKWTYDVDNRKKYPQNKIPPATHLIPADSYHAEACEYVQKHFPNHPGELNLKHRYPITPAEANNWLSEFLGQRMFYFGLYEDAIVKSESVLHHSLLTPMLNVGLITPKEIIEKTIKFCESNMIPLNSLEGFVRQIMGWREFIRAVYLMKGTEQRNSNFWNFRHEVPESFYKGTTGIEPIDATIKKVLKTGYCHHIERLMVLSNFMLLSEIHPNAVYRWFMEMFIDAYDWVMVPNVYGMGQFADGGLMCTKPYISGSNYIFKMSDYNKNQAWPAIWDGLFWNFMDKHRGFFMKNPRLGMLVSSFDKMAPDKKSAHLENASRFLQSIHFNTCDA